VIVPDGDLDAIAEAFGHAPYSVLPESSIIPELGVSPEAPGSFVQQLAKLAIAERIATDFYLTLDADVICVRNVSAADLVIGHRSIANASQLDHHPDWYEWAERVLGVPRRSRLTHAVTPAVLSREAMLRLQAHLATRSEDGNWRGYLLGNLPWTEYSLYYTFLESVGLFDRYHVLTDRPLLYGNCIWNKGQIKGWNPEKSFISGGPLFSVLQSHTGLRADEIWEWVGPFLQ
jgi:Family of unknown function (DUF6492)